ncbi:hypothetical protein OIU77_026407, partial [Salix suchowensis]
MLPLPLEGLPPHCSGTSSPRVGLGFCLIPEKRRESW